MQVAVHALDLSVVGIYLLDDDRDGIIQLLGNIMAAMPGNQFQTTALTRSCFDRLVDTVGLDGIIQIFVVRDLAVDGKGVVQKIKEIVGMQADGKALTLLGDRQIFQCLIVRLVQTVCKNLCDFYAFHRVLCRLIGFFRSSSGRRLFISRGFRFGGLRGCCWRCLFLAGGLWCFHRIFPVSGERRFGGRRDGRRGCLAIVRDLRRLGGFLTIGGGRGLGIRLFGRLSGLGERMGWTAGREKCVLVGDFFVIGH